MRMFALQPPALRLLLLGALLACAAHTRTARAAAPRHPHPIVAHPSDPRIFVVPLRGSAGVRFDMGVMQFVEAALAHQARPVPVQIARLAYRKSHVTPAGAKKSTANAQKLGRAAAAQYVLLVEAVGTAPKLVAHSVLIDVGSGRAIQSAFFALPGGRLSAAVGKHLVASILPKVGLKAPAHAPLRPGGPLAGSADPTDPDAPYNPAEMDATDHQVRRRAPSLQGHHDDRWRTGLRLSAAPLFLQRTGTITPKVANPNVVTPCYCGTARNANPYFVGGLLSVEVFPLALLGNGDSLTEGLGVHLEAALSGPETIVDPNSQKTIRSTMVDFKVGAQGRLVLWDSPIATDLQLDGGFTLYNFPLRSGGFPGVAYKAGYIGLTAHVPLGLPELVLVAGGHAVLGIKTGGDAANWLGSQKGGTGYNLLAGVHYQIGHFEVGGQYRYEVYASRFTGATAFPDGATRTTPTPLQLQDVTLHDKLSEFTITGSFTY